MINSDIRARVASIEARFIRRPEPAATSPAAPTTGLPSASSFQQVLASLQTTAAAQGTLGQMWAGAMREATLPSQPFASQGSGMAPGAAQFQPAFQSAGARYGVDPDLLAAVAWTESNFDPSAVSHAGAIGLMQIMPGTAEALGVNPRDPVQAIDGAARYLRDQLDRFGDVHLALAAYNAGPGAVEKYGGIPPYEETTAYVTKVIGRYDQLRTT